MQNIKVLRSIKSFKGCQGATKEDTEKLAHPHPLEGFSGFFTAETWPKKNSSWIILMVFLLTPLVGWQKTIKVTQFGRH